MKSWVFHPVWEKTCIAYGGVVLRNWSRMVDAVDVFDGRKWHPEGFE